VAALRRCAAWLVAGFALVAVLLGGVGLYGVTAYSVGQRTREIGLRLAMGAQRRSVVALVLGETARVAALGIGLGLAGAVAAGTATRALLFDTPPWDVPTLLLVAAVLAGVALLASWIPARRAVSVDPIEALRTE
jgi:ABC-type antimicrobial peptide transport system permease subunit